jgi:fructokinase
MSSLWGGLEAGGTKFVCVVGNASGEILARTRFPTTSPEATLRQTEEFYRPFAKTGELRGLGIGSFGPLDLNPDSPSFGFITSTPKPGWRDVDIKGMLERALHLPVSLDTDVNAAALGEHRWAAANREKNPLIYMTVGTGIGMGILIDGRPFHGHGHVEAGHFFLPHDRSADPFAGVCPFHGDCLEGLASGPSIAKRWGKPAEELPADHPAWALESRYLGFAIANLILAYSPEIIILGGGVSAHPGLHELVRIQAREALAGYIHSPEFDRHPGGFIIPPRLGQDSGVLGALALAIRE